MAIREAHLHSDSIESIIQRQKVKPMDGFMAFDAHAGSIDSWLNLMRKSAYLTLIDTTMKPHEEASNIEKDLNTIPT